MSDEQKKYFGYVKVFRQILLSDVSKENDSVFAAFIKILLMVKPSGQLDTGINEITKTLGFGSKHTTYRVLAALEACGCLKKESGKTLKITVLNWYKFQQKRSLKGVQKMHCESAKNAPDEVEQSAKSALQSAKNALTSAKSALQDTPLHNSVPVILNVKNNNKNIKNNNIYIPDLENQILQNAKNDFEIFWEKYPKKSGKQECFVWWQKNHKDLDFKKIMAGLDWYACCDRVTAGYCLDPIRFLKRSIWNDDPAAYNDKKRGNLPTPKGKYNV